MFEFSSNFAGTFHSFGYIIAKMRQARRGSRWWAYQILTRHSTTKTHLSTPVQFPSSSAKRFILSSSVYAAQKSQQQHSNANSGGDKREDTERASQLEQQTEAKEPKVRVGLVQLHSSSAHPEENQRKAEGLVRTAAANGARFILLPELYRTMLPRPEMPKYAEPVPDGPTSKRWSAIAAELGVWLLAGSMAEPSHDGKLLNTAVLFSDKGALVAKYSKIHLFDVNIPGVVQFQESAAISPGNQVVVAPTAFGRVGLAVCYDLRFPELFREQSRQGMDILCIPSAFSYGTGQKHWHTLVRARAIENLVYVVAPNQAKTAPNKFTSYGHSLVVDPWGNILAEGSEDEDIVYATLDPALLHKYRQELPALTHRRFDIFSNDNK
jgi:predicted amidohydrolase